MMKKLTFTLLYVAFSLGTTNTYATEAPNKLGELHIHVTPKNTQATIFFDRGLLLLHSFQYDEARENFISAQKIDKSFAMAYWGEAMTYNHPVWNEQDYNAATAALKRLAPTAEERMAKSPTALEKGFMNAVNQLYGQGSKVERDNYYEIAMQDLYKKFPKENEVASLYALAILGTTQGSRDVNNYMRAAGILEQVYENNRDHPGVLHYLIHTYDDPVHSPLGLRFADRYATVSPSAAHALHMPSHIYFSLGMWDKAAVSNQAAWNAGLAAEKRSGAYDIHALHGLQWLSYANLQLKNDNEAYHQVKTMEGIAQSDPANPMKQWYYAFMRAAYISDTRNWHNDLQEPNVKGIEVSAIANNLYIRGMQAINNKEHRTNIRTIIDEAQKLSVLTVTKEVDENDHHHGQSYFDTVNDTGITIAKIVYYELEAQYARSENKLTTAINFARQAREIENNLSFGYGPPIPVKPSDELLAEIYYENQQDDLAVEFYLKALKRNPNRRLSVEGLESAMNKLK